MGKKSDIADSREEALNLGWSRFRSDSPCIHGHVGQRYTITRNCVECATKRALEHRDREKVRFDAARKAAAEAVKQGEA